MKTTLSKSGFTATISHAGAELISLSDDNRREYIWEGNPAFWGKHSPILFPIVGTLKNNAYRHNGQTYQLPRHGFARERDFTLINRNDHEATLALIADAQTLEVYPFAFELHVIYSLSENGLTIGYRVFNRGHETMWFSIGAHPAFALPGRFEDYEIEFEKAETPSYHLLENDLVTDRTELLTPAGRRLPLGYELFANDALVFKKLESQSLAILHLGTPLLWVEFESFPNLGLWTKPEAPFLCIEPWFGYADTPSATGELSEKEGVLRLEPHGNFETKFRIMIR